MRERSFTGDVGTPPSGGSGGGAPKPLPPEGGVPLPTASPGSNHTHRAAPDPRTRFIVGTLGRGAYACTMCAVWSDNAALVRVSLLLMWQCLLYGCNAADQDFTAARERMVRQQLATPGRDITNGRVLAVMGKVPRHELVPAAMRAQAYSDYPLPIGYDQTISQPFIVAFMTEKLEPKPTDKVLEIGTGSGYQAAVLAELVSNVFTIEIVEPLARRAETDLKRLGYTNVFVRAGDGYKGWPEAAPFDAIIVTCAPERVPQPLVDQLKEGGRMIIPVGPAGDQELYVLRKKGDKVEQRTVLPVRFVPMTGKQRDGEKR